METALAPSETLENISKNMIDDIEIVRFFSCFWKITMVVLSWDESGKIWILVGKRGFSWKNMDSGGSKNDTQTRGNKSCRPFDGETPCPEPPPYLPPRLFLPRACSSFPTGLGQPASRGNNNNMNTIAFSRGPVPPSRQLNFN